MTGTWTRIAVAVATCAIAATGCYVAIGDTRGTAITAYFTTATAIYPGDSVRMSGVKVGTITAIDSAGTSAKMSLQLDRDIAVSADAKAVIVAQNLVSSRYVQLTPSYRRGTSRMADGTSIPLERTAVPVEWDEVKEQLSRLATDLGPRDQQSTTSVSHFIDSAATAMDGNGEKLSQTITQLASVGRILADGSGDVVTTIESLQDFVTALRDSNVQVVQFQDRLATLTEVVDGSRSDLDAALTKLADAVDDVKRFVSGSRDLTAEQVRRLANVTQTLVDHRDDVENLLHAAPNQFANAYNIYNPESGTVVGSFAFQNFANPITFLCSSIGAVENATAPETAKLCAQYLGPALRLLNFNNLPIPVAPILAKAPSPDSLIYSEPGLAPGNVQPPPDVAPPDVSAYTGLHGDNAASPGQGAPAGPPGAYAPTDLPADPSPALFPGAPIPPGVPAASSPGSVDGMLLPAEVPSPAPRGSQP